MDEGCRWLVRYVEIALKCALEGELETVVKVLREALKEFEEERVSEEDE